MKLWTIPSSARNCSHITRRARIRSRSKGNLQLVLASEGISDMWRQSFSPRNTWLFILTAWTDTQLAIAALFTGRADVLRSIAPKLVSATPGEFGFERFHLDAALALNAYAIGTHDKRLFLDAIKNLDIPQ